MCSNASYRMRKTPLLAQVVKSSFLQTANGRLTMASSSVYTVRQTMVMRRAVVGAYEVNCTIRGCVKSYTDIQDPRLKDQ